MLCALYCRLCACIARGFSLLLRACVRMYVSNALCMYHSEYGVKQTNSDK